MKLHIVRAPQSTTNTVKYFAMVVQNLEFENWVRNRNGRIRMDEEFYWIVTSIQFWLHTVYDICEVGWVHFFL